MKTRLASLVLLVLLFAGVVPAAGGIVSLTFANATGDTPALFTVYGNVFGEKNILEIGRWGTFWNHEWPISSVSDWAVLTDLVPDQGVFDDTEMSGKMMVWTRSSGERGLVRYHELTYKRAYPESWSHEIDVRQVLGRLGDLFSLLNVPGAFSYDERSSYGIWDGGYFTPVTVETAQGTLTLVGYDLSATCPPGTPACAPVPDPGSTLLLLGMSLVGLTAWKKRLG